jgi:hypothetical protein
MLTIKYDVLKGVRKLTERTESVLIVVGVFVEVPTM